MKRWLIIGAAFAALCALIVAQGIGIGKLRQERERNAKNVETLMGDVVRYKTKDSLNVATVNALELKVSEFERFRAEDARLIRSLKTNNRDLQSVVDAQTETILELRAIPKDTVIIRDSVEIPAKVVRSGDEWYDFEGVMTDSTFTGSLAVRDSLVVAETVKYKRFLGFLWKTKKVKDRKIDVVSKCPYTTIVGTEFVKIEK